MTPRISPLSLHHVPDDVTRILSQIESGDPSAAEQLLPLVYDELRRLAAAKLGPEQRITPYEALQAISNRLRSVYETRGSPQ